MYLHDIFKQDSPEKWQKLFQDPASSIMENIIDLHHDIMFFLIIISVFVSWILLRIIFFYNTNSETVRSLNLTHNTVLEVVWTFIPTLILMLIALPSYILIYNIDELYDPKITLKIIGHQWYWSYEYSDYSSTFNSDGKNELNFDSYMLKDEDLSRGDLRLLEVDNFIILPIKSSIRLLITASDVIHSWTIPSIGVKMDAIPGRLNQIGISIDRMSVFYGQCSELCGINHSFMPIGLDAVSFEQYLAWLTSKGIN